MSSVLLGAGLDSYRYQFGGKTEHALAEIIDNSIQWRKKGCAARVEVSVILDRERTISEIHIADNGVGMNKEDLEACLSFGGGKNIGINEDGRLGKFGLGLPYSSCNQSTRYTVVAWQGNLSNALSVTRDHEDYGPKDPVYPAKSTEFILGKKDKQIHKSYLNEPSGVIVKWERIDPNKVPAQATTLLNHFDFFLGRIYRNFLKDKSLDLTLKVLVDNGLTIIEEVSRNVKLNDPLYLTKGNCLPDEYSEKITNVIEEFKSKKQISDDLPGQKIFTHKEEVNGEEIEHKVVVKHSVINPTIYSIYKGKQAKQSKFVSNYLNNDGISLVRAGREIKLDWFGFSSSTGFAQMTRWIGIEVSFEPISDKLFDVQANKLDAMNFRNSSSDDIYDLQGKSASQAKFFIQLSNYISALLNNHLNYLKKINVTPEVIHEGCGGVIRKGECSECGEKFIQCPKHPKVKLIDGVCVACEIDTTEVCFYHKIPYKDNTCPKCPEREPLTEVEKKRVREYLTTFPEYKNNPKLVTEALSELQRNSKSFFFIYTSLPGNNTLLDFENVSNKFILIQINTEHVFYETVMKPLLQKPDNRNQIEPIKYLFGAIALVEATMTADKKILETWRGNLGYELQNVLSAYNTK